MSLPVVTAGGVRRWLGRTSAPAFMAYAVVAAFSTYFCMYAFRKPFAVGSYLGYTTLPWLGPVDTKALLIISQVVGYAISKIAGIKVVSEMPPPRRALAIVAAIATAELGLVLFGALPPALRPLCLLLNGLPLGMVWGLVFGFLEGRRVSDGLGAGLCASFIVASGFVKTVGKLLLDAGVSEGWMPAATGALFLPPLLVSVWLLAQLPPPSASDERQRLRRAPMDRRARWALFAQAAPGLLLLTAAYMLFTAYRDFRDSFAREIWDALGYAGQPTILTTAELPVAAGALLATATCMKITDNRRALLAIHGIMLLGTALLGGATLLYEMGAIGPASWMVLVGLGLYLGYVPYNCVLFDRMIPALGTVATAGFLIYLTDACGYAGSVALLLYKSLGRPELSWLGFFLRLSHVAAWAGAALLVLSAAYFARRTRPARSAA